MIFRKREDDRRKAKTKKPRFPVKKKLCRFCTDSKLMIDFKDGRALTPFLTERGKLIPRRISGNCERHQMEVTLAVKRSRIMAFIPFSATQSKGA